LPMPMAGRLARPLTVLAVLCCAAGKKHPAVQRLEIETFAQSVQTQPLLFVLFYSIEAMQDSFVLSHYTAAAETLQQQSVAVRFGWVEIDRADTANTFLQQYGVAALPDIKIFRRGERYDFQSGADAVDLVDVARWNAGRQALLHRDPGSKVVTVSGSKELNDLLTQNSIVLLAFSARWCTRCLALFPELDSASSLLAAADPPVAIGIVDIDDPQNRRVADEHRALSFPIGKIFHNGRYRADFQGGTAAHEIVSETLTVRDHLIRTSGTGAKGAKDEL